MYNNMQTSIAMSKSFKKKFKKAKLQAQYELKKELTDEDFIRLMMKRLLYKRIQGSAIGGKMVAYEM